METKNTKFLQDSENQNNLVLSIRDQFFDSLLHEWSRPPEDIDVLMGQDNCFYPADFIKKNVTSVKTETLDPIMIKDIKNGLLAVSITPDFNKGYLTDKGNVRWVYSILQAGDWLRYGLLIQGDPKKIFEYEQNHEYMASVESIWDRPCDHQIRDTAGLLLEWRFQEPDFYTNFVIRERFLIIARHLHFRLGRLIKPLEENMPYVSPSEHFENDEENNSSYLHEDLI